ncbi:unnamed protein product [Cercospora beticola]|nr:unnamed protein product [Cercospora beticola]
MRSHARRAPTSVHVPGVSPPDGQTLRFRSRAMGSGPSTGRRACLNSSTCPRRACSRSQNQSANTINTSAMSTSAGGIEYNPDLKGPDHFPVLCWGHNKLPKQKGQITYTLGRNQHRPTFALWNHGIVAGLRNTIRRSSGQALYVIPPFLAAWAAMTWAEERSRYLNSKKGRAEYDNEG